MEEIPCHIARCMAGQVPVQISATEGSSSWLEANLLLWGSLPGLGTHQHLRGQLSSPRMEHPMCRHSVLGAETPQPALHKHKAERVEKQDNSIFYGNSWGTSGSLRIQPEDFCRAASPGAKSGGC